MCGTGTFDLHAALHVLSEVGAEIEALDEDGEGPRATTAQVNVPAHQVSIGMASAADLREAHRRLGMTAGELYGDVTRPQASATLRREDGWEVVVYGPAGLSVIR